MSHKGHHGVTMRGLVVTPQRRKRDAAKRQREEARWAALSGPVTSYVDPTRIRRPSA